MHVVKSHTHLFKWGHSISSVHSATPETTASSCTLPVQRYTCTLPIFWSVFQFHLQPVRFFFVAFEVCIAINVDEALRGQNILI